MLALASQMYAGIFEGKFYNKIIFCSKRRIINLCGQSIKFEMLGSLKMSLL